jgi:predicted ABC-type sugar transport system permease subunit
VLPSKTPTVLQIRTVLQVIFDGVHVYCVGKEMLTIVLAGVEKLVVISNRYVVSMLVSPVSGVIVRYG